MTVPLSILLSVFATAATIGFATFWKWADYRKDPSAKMVPFLRAGAAATALLLMVGTVLLILQGFDLLNGNDSEEITPASPIESPAAAEWTEDFEGAILDLNRWRYVEGDGALIYQAGGALHLDAGSQNSTSAVRAEIAPLLEERSITAVSFRLTLESFASGKEGGAGLVVYLGEGGAARSVNIGPGLDGEHALNVDTCAEDGSCTHEFISQPGIRQQVSVRIVWTVGRIDYYVDDQRVSSEEVGSLRISRVGFFLTAEEDARFSVIADDLRIGP